MERETRVRLERHSSHLSFWSHILSLSSSARDTTQARQKNNKAIISEKIKGEMLTSKSYVPLPPSGGVVCK